MKKLTLLFFLLFSCFLFAQKKTGTHLLNYPIIQQEYLINQDKLLQKYNDPEYNIDTITFERCQLIGIEKDAFFKMNFYLFQDEDGIIFTLFEYYQDIKEDLKKFFPVVSSIYNLSSADIKTFSFNIKVIKPYYFLNNDMTSLHRNDPNLQKHTRSNKKLQDFWQIIYLEKNDIKSLSNNDKESESDDKNRISQNSAFKDWLTKEKNKLFPIKMKRLNYQLVSIEEVFESDFFLFTFYKGDSLEDYRLCYSTKIKNYIYVFGKRNILDENPDIDVINNSGKRFDLRVRNIKLPKISMNYKDNKTENLSLEENYILLKSGRVLGGLKYKKLNYFLYSIK